MSEHPMQPIKFVFDLDGTVTAEEPLPLMANHCKVEEEIDGLTSNEEGT